MAKYKIDWLEKGQYGTKVTAIDEAGRKFEATLGKEMDDVMAGHEINAKEWTSPKNGKLYLFKEEVRAKMTPPAFIQQARQAKGEEIKVAQERKEASIEKAQDRSAWMWAKINASTLIANSATTRDSSSLDTQGIADHVIDLATKIYNGEPVGGVDKELGF